MMTYNVRSGEISVLANGKEQPSINNVCDVVSDGHCICSSCGELHSSCSSRHIQESDMCSFGELSYEPAFTPGVLPSTAAL